MPELDWTGEFGGLLAVAFATGVVFASSILFKFVIQSLKHEISDLKKEVKGLYERVIEAVQHD